MEERNSEGAQVDSRPWAETERLYNPTHRIYFSAPASPTTPSASGPVDGDFGDLNPIVGRATVSRESITDYAYRIRQCLAHCTQDMSGALAALTERVRGREQPPLTLAEAARMQPDQVSLMLDGLSQQLRTAYATVQRDEALGANDRKVLDDYIHDTIRHLESFHNAILDLLSVNRASAGPPEANARLRLEADERLDELLADGEAGAGAAGAGGGDGNANTPARKRKKPDRTAVLMARRMVDFMRQRGYARHKETQSIVVQKVTSTGCLTNAWTRPENPKIDSYGALISLMTAKDTWFSEQVLTSGSGSIERLLKDNHYRGLVDVHPDRHVFAFRNGTLICLVDRDHKDFTPIFVEYFKDGRAPIMPPGTPNAGQPCPTACVYHDFDFQEAWTKLDDYMDVRTPTMDRVMDTQRLPPDVKRVYYAMLGRALFNMGEVDDWQVFLYVSGIPGSGKTTILKFVSSFYQPADTGSISNNMERQFGWSMLYTKYICIADDIKQDSTMDDATVQTMVSGAPLSMPVKGKDAITDVWKPSILMASNHMPRDTGTGAIARRALVVEYMQKVYATDTGLPQRFRSELPAALFKCLWAYRNLIHRAGTRDIWSVVPAYFSRIQARVTNTNNATARFINESLELRADYKMLLSEFRRKLQTFRQVNGYRNVTDPEEEAQAFVRFNLEKRTMQTIAGGHRQEWVVGAREKPSDFDMAPPAFVAPAPAPVPSAPAAPVRRLAVATLNGGPGPIGAQIVHVDDEDDPSMNPPAAKIAKTNP